MAQCICGVSYGCFIIALIDVRYSKFRLPGFGSMGQSEADVILIFGNCDAVGRRYGGSLATQ